MQARAKRQILEPVWLIDPRGNKFGLRNGRTKALFSIAGEGYPPIEFVTTRGAMQHGQTVRGYWLQPRVLAVNVRWMGCSRDEYWALRAELLNMIRPNRQSLTDPVRSFTLRRRLSDNSERQIDGFFTEGPQFVESLDRWQGWAFDEQLQFTCYDPVWYDPELQTATLVPTYTSGIVFPITFPITFGTNVVNQSLAVSYLGTWQSYPTLVVTGPATGVQLVHNEIGNKLQLDYTIANGEEVTFDLAYGEKTIENNSGENLIGYLTDDSDLANFRLEPDPTITNGANTINMACTDANASTRLTVQWYVRYIGI